MIRTGRVFTFVARVNASEPTTNNKRDDLSHRVAYQPVEQTTKYTPFQMKVGVVELVSNDPSQSHEHIQTQPNSLNAPTGTPHDGELFLGEGGHRARKDTGFEVLVIVDGREVWVGTLEFFNFEVVQVVARDLDFERYIYRNCIFM